MLQAFSVTDIGKRRQLNQDYVFAQETPLGNLANLFLVADGMGGHNAGDYASRYAVETVVREVKGSFEKSPVRILGKAIKVANDQIRRKAGEDVSLYGMGTTMVVAGTPAKGINILEISYSIGLAIGIIVFFNHIGGRRITKDPTPIEVEMRIYETDVNTALIETSDRQGDTIDV